MISSLKKDKRMAQLDWDNVTIMGHSRGGKIAALVYALSQPACGVKVARSSGMDINQDELDMFHQSGEGSCLSC